MFSRTTNDWVNPASVAMVVVSSSEGRALPYGKLEDVVSRDAAALNCHTNDDKYVRWSTFGTTHEMMIWSEITF